MSKVSVIIPVYNAEKFLDQCIQSVLNQTLKDIEIICVNDGSKDKSKEIMEKYAAMDSRVKVIDKLNSGYGNSMNYGLSASTGDYIGIVESDDYVVEYMFERLYSLTEEGSVDIVKGNFWDCYDEKDGSITKVVNQERENMPDVKEKFRVREYPQILWGHPSIWTGIYRRTFLLDNGITFKEVKGGGWVDNPFFFDTLCCAKSIKWAKEPLYCYRKNPESSSIGYDLAIPFDRMIDNLEVLKKRNFNDETILNFAYARALMYLCGAMEEKHYPQKMDYARIHMQKMLKEINPNVITDNFHLGDQKNYWKYISPLKTIMPKCAKILIYNWVPFDNPNHVGGGVTLYCKNLISEILRERPDVQVYFLSSGWAYDITTTECYIRKLDNEFGERCRTFEIVNSPVPAAQNMLLNNPTIAYENQTLKKQMEEFIQLYGPFNDIHFNNIEGLSLDVFDLKEKFPDTKFVFSIHNYAPFCITGFYFQRHNHCNCSSEHTGEDCLKCTNVFRRTNLRSEMVGRAKFNVWNSERYNEFAWVEKLGLDKLDEVADEQKFSQFIKKAVHSLNKNMDSILAVSDRVRQIAIANGLDESKVITSYIGTRIADFQVKCSVASQKSEYLKLGFLGTSVGYEEKGYPFLLRALEKLDKEHASKIDLVLTTTNGNEEVLKERLYNFHSVEIIHGYKHSDLKNILKDVHLGIIPVMWEDNLPQIAIEMVAMGVPILCSSFGGASELCQSDKFRFEGGNTKEFLDKIIYFQENPECIQEFWENHKGLVTMKMHFDEISKIYELPKKGVAEIGVDDYALLLDENDFLYKHFGHNEHAGEELRRKDELIQELTKQRDFLQYTIDATRNSRSFKLARMISFIPRKLRGDE